MDILRLTLVLRFLTVSKKLLITKIMEFRPFLSITKLEKWHLLKMEHIIKTIKKDFLLKMLIFYFYKNVYHLEN